jgi:malate dehydrogenase (oxaloacetate-decarboxylating)(NADP+)
MQKTGVDALRDKKLSKSTAFTKEERQELRLRGLLPHSIIGQDIQTQRVMANLRTKGANIEKYIFLSALQDRNERLYHHIIMNNLEELLPIIYTPTVGEVCMRFSHIYRIDKGFYITPEDKGDVLELLGNWPEEDINIIVVTDGSRILGLGDLGVNGIGISIGKLTLYTAGAGIHPAKCMPIVLDLGTNNESLRNDLLYLGYPHPRLEGEAYFEMVDEFIQGVQKRFPRALIQFEDFLTPMAYAILNKYQHQVLCFNDDIQGTASVAMAGIVASSKITGIDFNDYRIMFLGAGSAATGIADLLNQAFIAGGLSETDAKQRIWFVDIDGLLVKGRKNLMDHNRTYAHDYPEMNFIEAINDIKPHIIIGASGAGGAFTEEVIKAMTAINDRPVIFALSNPTSNSECTAAQAYEWSDGKAVFVSGSPFGTVTYKDKKFIPGQGNNVYIFPGIGLGAIASAAKYLPDSIFMTASKVLASQVTNDDIENGALYPKMSELRNISFNIAMAVANEIFELGLSNIERPSDLAGHIRSMMYEPAY